MDSLRRRLAVGLAYEQYVDEVEASAPPTAEIPTDDLRIECLTTVGTPAEQGFNQYIDAANDWGECIGEAGCDIGDGRTGAAAQAGGSPRATSPRRTAACASSAPAEAARRKTPRAARRTAPHGAC